MKRDLVVIHRTHQGWSWRYVAQDGTVLAEAGRAWPQIVACVAAARRVTGTRLWRWVKFVEGPPEA